MSIASTNIADMSQHVYMIIQCALTCVLINAELIIYEHEKSLSRINKTTQYVHTSRCLAYYGKHL